MFSFPCGAEKKNDPILENVLILVFRLVWKNQEMKPEVRNNVAREKIRPEVLASPKSFLEISLNAYVGFCN